MERQDKWILIVIISVCVICGVAVVAYLGYHVILFNRYLESMEARRPVLLYETDHRALLEACRVLPRQVASSQLKPGSYQVNSRNPDPESKLFPQLIQDLLPLRVDILKSGVVDIIMSSRVIYGVVAYPENYGSTPDDSLKYGDRLWGIELIDGLWYYDEDFQNHPEHMKELEQLLKKRKSEDSSGVP